MNPKIPTLSITILLGIFLLAFIGPFLYHTSPFALDKTVILSSSGWEHLLGTDRLGRDLLARIMHGGQVSLIIGVGSAVIASLIGLLFGVGAGYFKGYLDKSFVMIVDLFLTFPTFFSCLRWSVISLPRH